MIADLKPYPAMKDSGVEWLGEVPEHWEVRRNGRLFGQRNETGYPDLPILEVSLRTGIRVRDFEQSERKQVMTDRDKYKRSAQGDIAYNMMRMWQGAVGVTPTDGLISPAYVVARPFPGTNSKYYNELFRTGVYMREVDKYSRGIVKDRNRLYWEDFKSMPSCYPPLPEQAAIVRYLDHVDRRVRRLVRAKQKLIGLLEEQKQAIIHRAVTRGLDSDVSLKDSGVEWLGEVPEHWKIKKIHQVTNPKRPVMYGIVLPGPNVDEGVFIVKGGNCEPGRLRADRLSKTTFEIESRYTRSRLAGQDIVIAIRGGVGASELVPDELAGANLTQDAARIAARDGVYPQWLLYAVRSQIFQEHVQSVIVGATVRGINIRDLKRIQVVVPPHSEQTAIADYLNEATEQIGTTSDRARREIELLREYRTRLIADVVTGKLDVREVAARLPDEADESELLDVADDLMDDADAPGEADALPEEDGE
jgi:type I restriction enzyme, S subunit